MVPLDVRICQWGCDQVNQTGLKRSNSPDAKENLGAHSVQEFCTFWHFVFLSPDPSVLSWEETVGHYTQY